MEAKSQHQPSSLNRITVAELSAARALESCLEALERGENDLDKLADGFPAARDEIRPLLEIALQLRERRAGGAVLPLDFKEELRRRLVAHSQNR